MQKAIRPYKKLSSVSEYMSNTQQLVVFLHTSNGQCIKAIKQFHLQYQIIKYIGYIYSNRYKTCKLKSTQHC